MHRDIDRIARAFSLRWTMYVDDIALSGERAREAVTPVIRALQSHGFGVSQEKLHVMSGDDRQMITGGVVNQKLSVGRRFIDGVRSSIIEVANRPGEIYDKEIASIRGKIQHVRWINPLQGVVLERLAERLLPDPTVSAKPASKGRTRACRSFRRNHGA